MNIRVSTSKSLSGSIRLPGDKSISHRYAILSAIAEGVTRIRNYSTGADCQSTLDCLSALGVEIRREGGEVEVRGTGLDGLREACGTLDAGNSGSTIRMLSGILAAQPFLTRIQGDESLSLRPMERIMKPLARMGARISARDGRFPPLEIHPAQLTPIEYELPVASAQVKSCILFAGLYAEGDTTVIEPVRTRDHSELALREFGADVVTSGSRIRVTGQPRLAGGDMTVPGDISSAAFFLVAALLIPGSHLTIQNVGLNPTRAGLLDLLAGMGAPIRITNLAQRHGETVGDLEVEHARLRGGVIDGALTAALIDEIPILAVLGAATEEGITVRDAAELRVKETDRIATVAANLRLMGVDVEEWPDGLRVGGHQRFSPSEVDSFGDHRIAMAFAIAALAADGESVIRSGEAASVSYPEFFDTLGAMTA